MRYKIIDADRHVIEPLSMWSEYLDDDIQRSAPLAKKIESMETVLERFHRLGLETPLQLSELFLKDKPLLKHWYEAAKMESDKDKEFRAQQLSRGSCPEAQLKAMVESGIEKAHMLPTYAVWLVNNDNLTPNESLGYANAYNNWLYDYCKSDPVKLKGAGVISRHDPVNMIEQVENVIAKGWYAIALFPGIVNGRDLGHSDYNDFWAFCSKKNVAIAFHGGTHVQSKTAGSDRYKSHFALHACSHSFEIQMAFLSLLESGVLERNPELKIGFLEAGCSWVPHWLWRLDHICYGDMPGEVAQNITMKPSEYFKKHCWVAFEIGEPGITEVINCIGIERLIFGSDFPHIDHVQFNLDSLNSESLKFTDKQLSMVLEENALAFFGDW